MTRRGSEWFDDDTTDEEVVHTFKEYEISSSPNDFNIKTIFDFIESGVVKIPIFQRNYVWDIKRASRLIESILIGLPIPQIFLYEKSKNDFLVIDGQQRLMSIYYFMKQKFPKRESRGELRRIFNEKGHIPDTVLHDNKYFSDFNLQLKRVDTPNEHNKLHGLNYARLGEYTNTFHLRTMRNVIIKQNVPPEDDSSIYEIFYRLNSGGINLKPQEIRASLYHSAFFTMLYRLNNNKQWRRLLGIKEPDIHMKDVEILTRSFAMLMNHSDYKSPMTKFINQFCAKCSALKPETIEYFEKLFVSFLDASDGLDKKAFISKAQKFNISMFEAVFVSICSPLMDKKRFVNNRIPSMKLERLKNDEDFINAAQSETARATNVKIRLSRARNILG